MKYCTHCGKPNVDGAQFCGRCGKPFAVSQQVNESSQTTHSTTNISGSSFIDSINDFVGNDRPVDLNWKVLFTDVFKHHTTDEAEAVFICGTKTTTPNPASVAKDWPHPWLWSRVLFTFLVTFVLLWVCVDVLSNDNAIPGLIVVGSFAAPISTMILFMETNVWRNVSMFHVLQIFLIGGCASLVTTLILFSFFPVGELDFWGAFTVGVVEEVGKAIIVFVFLKRLGQNSILEGLLIGACVGAGFAAFESAGYALRPFMSFMQSSGYAAAYGMSAGTQDQIMDVVNNVILIRGVLAPGGHVAWAAITGAALVITSKALGKFETGICTDKRFLRLFAIPVVLHGLWDCPLAEGLNQIFPFVGYIILLVLVWIVILILINMGLAEVSHERRT